MAVVLELAGREPRLACSLFNLLLVDTTAFGATRAGVLPARDGVLAAAFCPAADNMLVVGFASGFAAPLTATVEGSFARDSEWILAATADANLAAERAGFLGRTLDTGLAAFRGGVFDLPFRVRFGAPRAGVRVDERLGLFLLFLEGLLVFEREFCFI